MSVIKDLGAVTAYGYAVDQGYTGTEAEFAALMASYASVAEDAAASATAAATSEDNAEAWAVGQINGTDVGSSDARYHNNSKYYSEQSANSAAEAAASAASLDVETILGDFATYEPEATAAYSHTKDKYLIWSDSKLYKVTANISVGDTIAKGTNIASNPTTVGDEVAALNSNLTQYYYQTGLRFKNLGSSFTTAQATALANGDFSDFWNGDYWTINGVNWRIVDNTGIARRRGDTNFDKNSLIIMPDTNLVSAAAFLVDSANDSGHGYSNSGYRSSYRSTCKSTIASAFGSSHIASHRELMSNARGSAGATGWAWTDADVELPSEFNIYGGSSFGASSLGGAGGYNVGSQWGQFALFRLAPYMAINRSINYWLRDIINASAFAYVANYGAAHSATPSYANVGLRPFFILV